ncbi:MAG: glycoside hydrolase family 88 protein [Prevotellaceae bacterium]|jgi:chondroitin AC lyase|nr:glycoside hydrolase family 88 protein [Prevotellaceae bacterium]
MHHYTQTVFSPRRFFVRRVALRIVAAFALLWGVLFPCALQAGSRSPDKAAEQEWIAATVRFAVEQTDRMLQSLDPAATPTQYPRTTDKNGRLTTVGMHEWTSGFFPGVLWYLYELSGDDALKSHAEAWTQTLEPLKTYTATHDLGFMLYNSFGHRRRLAAGDTAAVDAVLWQGARSLASRFNDTVQSLKSWQGGRSWHGSQWAFPVIIDNMMNLELLMWAARNAPGTDEADRFRHIAAAHAGTTIKNHLRPDYSCYHVVDYDPATGRVREKGTAQGWSDQSTWARGQAWGIYGFTMMFRETGDRAYLETAERMAGFFLTHPRLPDDKIPYWDFNAGQPGYTPVWPDRTPALPLPPDRFPVAQYRDASAGAILAAALFELYTYTGNEVFRAAATDILHRLASDDYRATPGENAGFLLKHGVGSIPHGSEIDVPLIYADYYFLEALLRYKKLLERRTPQRGDEEWS